MCKTWLTVNITQRRKVNLNGDFIKVLTEAICCVVIAAVKEFIDEI